MTRTRFEHGIIITMDPDRRIIEDGTVVVENDRILAVGPTAEVAAALPVGDDVRIDSTDKVILPGLIDGHAHAGHTLLKTLGTEQIGVWNEACYKLYQHNSDDEFWYTDALLSGLERVKFGVTTSMNMFGGGDMVMRSDDPRYAQAHTRAIDECGIREFLAVGPGFPPYPKDYTDLTSGQPVSRTISFENEMATCEAIIQTCHGAANGRQHICMTAPAIHPDQLTAEELDVLGAEVKAVRQFGKSKGVRFTQDGHMRGSIAYANDVLGILGPDVFFSHNINIDEYEQQLCAQSGTNIVNNPSAIMSILGRCPVPELLDLGVTVFLGSDAAAPNRSYDMFRHMFQAMHYHRTFFHDPSILPPGKALEMVTIDAAKGLGLEKEIGSLEAGKKGDLITVDMRKPHLYPLNMPLHRVVYYANGNDVDTVMVDGKILMQGRVLTSLDQDRILNQAQQVAEKAFTRAEIHDLKALVPNIWGKSRL